MYTLPDDAPDILHELLQMWHEVSKDHKPSKRDLPFDDLVGEHPGLFWVERTDQSPMDFDLRFIKAGPEVLRRNKPGALEAVFSEILSANTFSFIPDIFGGCLRNGEPHYWEIIASEYGKLPLRYQRLVLPLFDEAGVAVSLLASSVYSEV
ncbi:MAG: hypothetical protein ABJ360_25115 [Roseobacter sp.]